MADRDALAETLAAGTFALHCRGDVRLYRGEADCTPTPKKGRALLAILAAEQRPLTRVKLIDLLWSDRQEEQARASLRTLLADLKEQFAERFDELLVVERERIALAPSVRTDLTDPTLARPVGELFEGLDHIDPELDQWLRLERERWAAALPLQAQAGRHSERSRPVRWTPARKALGGLVLVLLAFGAILTFGSWTRAQPPVVAVLPVGGISNEQQSLFAEYLIDGVTADLRSHPAIRVVSNESAKAFARAPLNPVELHRRFGIDLLIVTSIRNLGDHDRLVARLIHAGSGSELWSADYSIGRSKIVRTRDKIVEDLGARIHETIPSSQHNSLVKWTRGRSGQQLSEARRLLELAMPERTMEARRLLLDLAAAQPDNVLALAALAEATMAASDYYTTGGPLPLADARREARAYANRAIRLAPDAPAGYAALAASYMETAQAVPPLERAVALEPNNYRYRVRLARAYEYLDRYEQAYKQEKEALRLEPLSVAAISGLIRNGYYFGARAEVAAAARRFASLSPPLDPADATVVLAYASYMTDDFGDCVRRMRRSPKVLTHPRHRNTLVSCLIALRGADEAYAIVRNEGSLQKDILSGDINAVARRASALGPDFWRRNEDTVAAAEMLAQAGRNGLLLSLFDQSYNSIEEFETEGGLLTIYPQALWVVMQRTGRTADAAKVQQLIARNVRRARTIKGLWESVLYDEASLAMTKGDRSGAITLLERCYPSCFYSHTGRDLSSDPLFSALNGTPSFDRLILRYRRWVNDQRRVAGLRPLPLSEEKSNERTRPTLNA